MFDWVKGTSGSIISTIKGNNTSDLDVSNNKLLFIVIDSSCILDCDSHLVVVAE